MKSISHRIEKLSALLSITTPPIAHGMMGIVTHLGSGSSMQRILSILLMGLSKKADPSKFQMSVELFKDCLVDLEKFRLKFYAEAEPLVYSDELYIEFLLYLSGLVPFVLIDIKDRSFHIADKGLVEELHLAESYAQTIYNKKIN